MASSISVTKPHNRICSFCNCSNPPYVCPRCNLSYCSSECYKNIKHSNCSEEFYREWVESHLKGTKSSSEDQKRVENILRRVYQQDTEELDSDDDDGYPDLNQRFSGIDLDSVDDVWERLNNKEKQEFTTLIKTGEAAKLLTLWEPWWLFKTKLQLIKDLEDEVQKTDMHPCPGIQEDIPSLKQLLSKVATFKLKKLELTQVNLLIIMYKVSPSPFVKYDVINVLYGYAYVARLYNGDHSDFVVEAVENVIKISRSLDKSQMWKNCDEAITDAILQLEQHKDMINSNDFVVAIIADVKSIMEGPDHKNLTKYILAAISDMARLVKGARETLKMQQKLSKRESTGQQSGSRSDSKELIAKLRAVEKRLQFFLSWAKDYFHDLPPLILELDLCHAMKLQEMVTFEEQQKDVTATSNSLRVKSTKIEEIN